MGQMTVEVNGRPYEVGCEDGQEAQLTNLAEIVDARVRELAPGAGPLGETRLILMGALMIASEMDEAKALLVIARSRIAALEEERASLEEKAAQALEAAARKLEAMASR
jgi:cell division protein ZapA